MKTTAILSAKALALFQLVLAAAAATLAPLVAHAGIDLTDIPQSQWQSLFPEPDRRAADCSPGRHWELLGPEGDKRARCVCDGDLSHTVVGNNYPEACTTLPVAYGGQTCVGYDLYNWYYPYGNQVLIQSYSPTCGAPTTAPPTPTPTFTAGTYTGKATISQACTGDVDYPLTAVVSSSGSVTMTVNGYIVVGTNDNAALVNGTGSCTTSLDASGNGSCQIPGMYADNGAATTFTVYTFNSNSTQGYATIDGVMCGAQ